MWTLVIPRVLPSTNLFMRWPWQKRYDLIGEFRHDIWALCNLNHVEPCAKLHLDCTIYFRRWAGQEPQNYVTTLDKLCFDALERLGYIENDKPEHLTWSIPILEVDSKNPRTILTLTPLEK